MPFPSLIGLLDILPNWKWVSEARAGKVFLVCPGSTISIKECYWGLWQRLMEHIWGLLTPCLSARDWLSLLWPVMLLQHRATKRSSTFLLLRSSILLCTLFGRVKDNPKVTHSLPGLTFSLWGTCMNSLPTPQAVQTASSAAVFSLLKCPEVYCPLDLSQWVIGQAVVCPAFQKIPINHSKQSN